MPEVKEDDIYNALLRFKGENKAKIGAAEILLSLVPEDIHKFDRPDSILWVNISLKIFGQILKIRLPIPVEGEKHAIEAQKDLEEFVKREKYLIEVPMLVIAEAGYRRREEPPKLFPVKFTITQIPVRRLRDE
jgi:hypothetical protein